MMTWMQPDHANQPGTLEARTALEAKGFDTLHTGGGCWCMYKEPEGTTLNIVITETGGTGLPTEDDWSIALYATDNWQPEDLLFDRASGDGQGGTMWEVLAEAEAKLEEIKPDWPDSWPEDEESTPIVGEAGATVGEARPTVLDYLQQHFPNGEMSAEDAETLASIPMNSAVGEESKAAIDGAAALAKAVLMADGERYGSEDLKWIVARAVRCCSIFMRG